MFIAGYYCSDHIKLEDVAACGILENTIEVHMQFSYKNLKEEDHKEYLRINEKTTLKLI